MLVSARHAGSTHDSTAFQATLIYSVLKPGGLHSWPRIAADDAYADSQHILTPYSGLGLSLRRNAFNSYLSSCRITDEHAFGMLIYRFGFFWSPLRFSVCRSAPIVAVCCKAHDYLHESGDKNYFETLDTAQENDVQGTPFAHT